MRQRHLTILFAVSLAVLAVAVWVAQRAQYGGASIAGTLVLPGLEHDLNAVTRVRITGAGGKHATLVKGASHWMVSERGYPADSGKLRKLLIDLGNLKAVARKTRLAKDYPVLGVQPVTAAGASGVRVDVVSPHRTWSLIVGHNDQGTGSYVRRVGHKQSLLVAPVILAEAKPAHWLEPIIVDIGEKQVRSVQEHPAGKRAYRIERAKAASANFRVLGIPRGRKLASPGAADSVAAALSNLTLRDVRKAVPAPKDVRLSTARFTTFKDLTVTVSGYGAAKHGPHYIEVTARAGGPKATALAARINARVHGWQYRIAGYTYRQIFQPLSGLLQPLPKHHRVARRKPAP